MLGKAYNSTSQPWSSTAQSWVVLISWLIVFCMGLCQHVSCLAGGIISLQRLWPNGRVGTQWADPKNPLGRFVYSSYTQADYAELFATYMYIDPTEWWVSRDYGKYNVSEANPKRKDAFPDAEQFWFRKVSNNVSVHIETGMALCSRCLTSVPASKCLVRHSGRNRAFQTDFQHASQTPCSPPSETCRGTCMSKRSFLASMTALLRSAIL